MLIAVRICALAGCRVGPTDGAALAAAAAPCVADPAEAPAAEYFVRLIEPHGPHLRVVPGHAEDATA